MDKLLLAAKAIRRRAQQRLNEGKASMAFGLDGFLALMHDRLIKYTETRDDDCLANLATDAMIAFSMVIPDMQEETTTEEIISDVQQQLDQLPDPEDDREWKPRQEETIVAEEDDEQSN